MHFLTHLGTQAVLLLDDIETAGQATTKLPRSFGPY